MPVKTYELPLAIPSPANIREHWAKRAKRTKAHRMAACIVQPRLPLPASVTLTRIAARPLDSDNLAHAFKALRDGIADRFGIADNHPDLYFSYAQKRGKPKQQAVIIEIFHA